MTDPGSRDSVRPDPTTPVDPPLRLPDPDWLHHRLHVTGLAETVALFSAAAQGAGTMGLPHFV